MGIGLNTWRESVAATNVHIQRGWSYLGSLANLGMVMVLMLGT